MLRYQVGLLWDLAILESSVFVEPGRAVERWPKLVLSGQAKAATSYMLTP
jgi:hypothetical protein